MPLLLRTTGVHNGSAGLRGPVLHHDHLVAVGWSSAVRRGTDGADDLHVGREFLSLGSAGNASDGECRDNEPARGLFRGMD
jgi:hydrogenase/urease accessory protein HupE